MGEKRIGAERYFLVEWKDSFVYEHDLHAPPAVRGQSTGSRGHTAAPLASENAAATSKSRPRLSKGIAAAASAKKWLMINHHFLPPEKSESTADPVGRR